MFSFSQSLTPAVQDHVRTQFSFVGDMSQKLFDTAQRINELNVQVAKTLMEESFQTTQQVITAQDPLEALSIITGQAQPNAEKIRAYQQHLTHIAAGTQVELVRTAESRVPEATRTATALAEEVTRRASEQTQQAAERQRAAMDKLSNPIRPTSAANKAAGAQSKAPAAGTQGGVH